MSDLSFDEKDAMSVRLGAPPAGTRMFGICLSPFRKVVLLEDGKPIAVTICAESGVLRLDAAITTDGTKNYTARLWQ